MNEQRETTRTVIFDGGTSCNIPSRGFGHGYGSFKVDDLPIERVKFGIGHSNNSAEIRTLISALNWIRDNLGVCRLKVIGDSKIALKWVHCNYDPKPYNGKAPSNNFVEAIKLLREAKVGFKITTQWWGRENNVRILGH